MQRVLKKKTKKLCNFVDSPLGTILFNCVYNIVILNAIHNEMESKETSEMSFYTTECPILSVVRGLRPHCFVVDVKCLQQKSAEINFIFILTFYTIFNL